ncbi:MAG: MoxR family ATPase [Planctomycetota bacterium]
MVKPPPIEPSLSDASTSPSERISSDPNRSAPVAGSAGPGSTAPAGTRAADPLTAGDIASAEELVRRIAEIKNQVRRVVVGQDDVIDQLLIAILSRGHCLLEGVPGLAKTLMVRTLASSMSLNFRRIQFTPDLMPGDITGTDIIQEDHESGRRELVFRPGPVFTQMLLADEINRTPPKTQAALLEAMQEHEVTAGGKTYRLTEPFFVLATQNPIEQEGTYPLPEAQRDRFLFHVVVDYPSRDEEAEIIDRTTSTVNTDVKSVISGQDIVQFQSLVRKVPLPPHVKHWVIDLVRRARPAQPEAADWVRQWIQWGPGPRASQQLVLSAKVRALLAGRSHVTIDDCKTLAHPVLRHRIVPTFAAEAENLGVDDLIDRLLQTHRQPGDHVS